MKVPMPDVGEFPTTNSGCGGSGASLRTSVYRRSKSLEILPVSAIFRDARRGFKAAMFHPQLVCCQPDQVLDSRGRPGRVPRGTKDPMCVMRCFASVHYRAWLKKGCLQAATPVLPDSRICDIFRYCAASRWTASKSKLSSGSWLFSALTHCAESAGRW